MARTVEDLKKELAQAEAREALERKIRREATPVKFEYYILPASPDAGKMYDPTCHAYEISRRVTNRDAASRAGWGEEDFIDGSATYFYNVVTRRIITTTGSGTIYITPALDAEDFADDTAFFRIGAFLAECPAGGDITQIVEDFYAERKAAKNGK